MADFLSVHVSVEIILRTGCFLISPSLWRGLTPRKIIASQKINSSHTWREWVLGRASGSNQMCRYLRCSRMHQLSPLWLAHCLTISLLANHGRKMLTHMVQTAYKCWFMIFFNLSLKYKSDSSRKKQGLQKTRWPAFAGRVFSNKTRLKNTP